MSGARNILFVEDDGMIASGLRYMFESEGYTVTHCGNVAEALGQIACKDFDIAVLDLSLPDGSGFDICKAIKKKGGVPVIFLTAADDEGNTVKGLEMGADDYISKPFRIRELMARIKGVLRRAPSAESLKTVKSDGVLRVGDVKIDTGQGKTYKGEEEIFLTASEYRLLLILAKNKGQVLSRGRLLEVLWDSAGGFVNDNTLTVCMKRLREKLRDDPQEPKIIETVRGIGYRAVCGE